MVATAILVGVCLIVGCIYAVFDNFGKGKSEITVFTPDGAPALSMAKLFAEDTVNDRVTYTVVSATGIEARVLYSDMKKNADVCVLPITDASLHIGDGENYQLLGVVTHGNFFLISETETVYRKDNLLDLVGKKVGFVQLAKLPGLVFRSILERENVPYKIQTDYSAFDADVVNLINVKPTDVKSGIGIDVYAVPEPLASLKVNGVGFKAVGSVQDLYGGERGYPQAVVVAKRSLIENNPLWIASFVKKLTDNDAWLQSAEIDSILTAINSHLETGLTPAFTDKNLTGEVVTRCAVKYVGGYSSKTEIIELITALKKIDVNAVGNFSERFFNEKY